VKPWALFIAVIALALAIAAVALRPPSPLPSDAPAQRFSAARALSDVAAIAQRPHPIRSPEQARVRDALFVRMADLGLAPRLRPVDSDRGNLFNLLGVLPGADRAQPAVLLMAHFDSVPAGPGAADDSAGVAAILETVRALKAAGPLKRDVMVLLTDGEEPGLYGARAFFSADPLRTHVGVVINLEARGDRGRAVMFETHRRSGPLIAFLADRGALSGASSLMPDLYRRLPNNTDLTEALKRGDAGLNFAFFGGLDAYHRPTDTPARLDLGSLQSIGDQALAAAKALAMAPALPGRAPDQVYADILGGPILRYPVAAGWALLAVAVSGLAIAATHALVEKQTSAWGLAAGALTALGLMVGLCVILWAGGLLRASLAHGRLDPLLRHAGYVLAGSVGLACGGGLIWYWLARRGMMAASLRLGTLIALALLTIALQALAPLDAFIVAWPLALAALAVVLQARFADKPLAAAPVVLFAVAQLSYWLGLIFILQGQIAPVVLAPFFVLIAITLLPLAPPSARGAGWTGAACLAAGLAASVLALGG
jgi:hypothetical protein